jgi:hypothetical protein
MHLSALRIFCRLLFFTSVLPLVLWWTCSVSAQSFAIGAGENPWSESSLTPFEIQIIGVINADIAKENIAEVKLGIAKFHESYHFDITKMKATSYPQVSATQILPRKGNRQYDFELIGPSALLSKVAQAQPGTPLRIVGMYVRRDQKLQLLSVDVVDADSQSAENNQGE